MSILTGEYPMGRGEPPETEREQKDGDRVEVKSRAEKSSACGARRC
jgi:hypothetical protein